MLRSYVAFAARGDVVLRQEIISQLGIGPNGLLYGVLHPPETALVLSQIPPACWQHALKIIIHTHSRPGSLAAAARAIAQAECDTISSWASTESFYGHLCSTSIVVPLNATACRFETPAALEGELMDSLKDHLSDLPTFGATSLRPVRVTPLSILSTYGRELAAADYQIVEISQHSLRLGASRALDSKPSPTLWEQLLQASDSQEVSACILTPDTEEAFLRVCAIPENARLTRISYRMRIDADKSSFAGYWQRALQTLRDHKHSVFVANNLLISKRDEPRTEEAEFHFLTDRRNSSDTGLSLHDLRAAWHDRFRDALGALARERQGLLEGETRVTRPRGVGVPCFIATNAKPGDGVGAHAAYELCRTLEGHGFKPVNVDIAAGGEGLQEQVKELIAACRFMVVLHCPEGKHLRESEGLCGLSDWVIFEEVAMLQKGGELIRYRFANVRGASFNRGYLEKQIPETGITPSIIEDFAERIERWMRLMYDLRSDNVHAADIPGKHLERDLVSYYGGRTSA